MGRSTRTSGKKKNKSKGKAATTNGTSKTRPRT